ncbi:MAG: tyrosine-type recombinase/integrase, partial [Clostridia bacterium]|nr:tyrosine-type recombinase/integrase [Clostridia bacterium]
PYLDDLFEGITLGSYTYSGIRKAFTNALKKSGITGVLIHNTRHTFSSLCYYHGVPDKLIQAWMGHSTVAMTMDTYTHVMDIGTSPISAYVARLRDVYVHIHA